MHAPIPPPHAVTPIAVGTNHTYYCNDKYIVTETFTQKDKDYVKVCQVQASAKYRAEWTLKAGEPENARCVGMHKF